MEDVKGVIRSSLRSEGRTWTGVPPLRRILGRRGAAGRRENLVETSPPRQKPHRIAGIRGSALPVSPESEG